MKVSVSLPDEDVEFLDRYAASSGHRLSIRRTPQGRPPAQGDGVGPAYEQAWADWASDDDSDLWETTTGDGLADAAR